MYVVSTFHVVVRSIDVSCKHSHHVYIYTCNAQNFVHSQAPNRLPSLLFIIEILAYKCLIRVCGVTAGGPYGQRPTTARPCQSYGTQFH